MPEIIHQLPNTLQMTKIIEKWSKQLNALLRDKNISVSELSRLTGIKRDTIYAYLSSSANPSGSKLFAIANATGVSIDWLAGRPGAAREYGEEHKITSINAAIEEATGLIRVPYYDLAASAGNPRMVDSEEIASWIWIERGWAKRFGKTSLSIIKALGDSMVPVIEPGSLIMVNLADVSLNEGIKAVRVDDGLVVKRCEPRPKGGLQLVSDNPGYEPYTAKKGEYEIIGAVVAVIKVME